MTQRKSLRSAFFSTRFVLVILTVSALTASLVTRTVRIQVSQNPIKVQSNSPQAMRQHLDCDAIPWVPPIRHFAPLLDSAFAPRKAPAWLRLPGLLLGESLYNRPPPSC
jgi:hypothetical protein